MFGDAAVFFGLAYVAYMLWFALVMWQAKGAVKWLFGARKVGVSAAVAAKVSPVVAQWVRPIFMPLGLPAPA